MWQKVNPMWMRVWIMRSWPCEWYAKNKQQASDFFVEDIKIREFIDKFYPRAGISKVVIRKTEKESALIIFTAKVGILMGKQWAQLKVFEKALEKQFHKPFKVIIKEVRNPEYSAKIMAEFIAQQLETRMPYRRVAKGVLQKVMWKGATGIKIQIGWRLNGADIARREKFIDGRVSLQTFRADIDYHYLQAMTKYGVLWVKVWIQKGVLFRNAPKKNKLKSKRQEALDNL